MKSLHILSFFFLFGYITFYLFISRENVFVHLKIDENLEIMKNKRGRAMEREKVGEKLIVGPIFLFLRRSSIILDGGRILTLYIFYKL